jgi:outer membrane lipoprotein SlyB
MRRFLIIMAVLFVMNGLSACSAPLTTRETGAAVGTLGGAAAGGIVGSAVGHPGAGAAVGGALGLGAGALIGDRLQAVEQKQSDLEKQIKENEAELQRQRQELEQLKKQTEH